MISTWHSPDLDWLLTGLPMSSSASVRVLSEPDPLESSLISSAKGASSIKRYHSLTYYHYQYHYYYYYHYNYITVWYYSFHWSGTYCIFFLYCGPNCNNSEWPKRIAVEITAKLNELNKEKTTPHSYNILFDSIAQ